MNSDSNQETIRKLSLSQTDLENNPKDSNDKEIESSVITTLCQLKGFEELISLLKVMARSRGLSFLRKEFTQGIKCLRDAMMLSELYEILEIHFKANKSIEENFLISAIKLFKPESQQKLIVLIIEKKIPLESSFYTKLIDVLVSDNQINSAMVFFFMFDYNFEGYNFPNVNLLIDKVIYNDLLKRFFDLYQTQYILNERVYGSSNINSNNNKKFNKESVKCDILTEKEGKSYCISNYDQKSSFTDAYMCGYSYDISYTTHKSEVITENPKENRKNTTEKTGVEESLMSNQEEAINKTECDPSEESENVFIEDADFEKLLHEIGIKVQESLSLGKKESEEIKELIHSKLPIRDHSTKELGMVEESEENSSLFDKTINKDFIKNPALEEIISNTLLTELAKKTEKFDYSLLETIFSEILNSNIKLKDYSVAQAVLTLCSLLTFDFNRIHLFLIKIKKKLNQNIIENLIERFYLAKDKFCLMSLMRICEEDLNINLSKSGINERVYLMAIELMFELSCGV
eukprot:CAMPEP_0170528750 /NCGR_PEP_ID=MMETSP0209-20121228/14228_1 /TAXON_ID=665100 ORGANISM="Litonotus pictus, Strain P1" /NCGR_SAMPLE_ID=MMETSP0209 /ASSEMBLY_ACC=CAM_ASM_000301 /LENGTH=517 /DNA_ID=CAMNT_0010820145 /DNA_START=11 /DNA_END=1561 /DNA_ORIENTATION=+